MTTPAWHADDDDLLRLRDGSTGPVLAASLEAHVMGCRGCRQRMNALSFDDHLEQVWSGVRAAVETPRPGFVERLLTRLGSSVESARLLAAVPSLRAGWLTGVSFAVLFAGGAAALAVDVGLLLFLVVAPLAPVAGVAAAFGGDADPSHELVATTPYPRSRLLALRTVAVLISSVPVTVAVGLVLPAPAWLAVAWLTPAATGVALTLVLAKPFGVVAAASAVATGWVGACLAAARAQEPLLVLEPVTQGALLLVLGVCGVALVRALRTLDMPGRLS